MTTPSDPVLTKLAKDVGTIHNTIFQHNIAPELNFFVREMEKKREGNAESLEESLRLLKEINIKLVDNEQVIDANRSKILNKIGQVQTILQAQLKKEEEYKKQRDDFREMRTPAEEEGKKAFLEQQQKERALLQKLFEREVLKLEEKYKVMAPPLSST